MYSLASFSIMALNSRITGTRSLGFSSTCFAIPSSQSFWIRWSWGSHPPVLFRRGQFDWVIEDDGTIENRPMHVMFFGYGRHDDCSEAIMIVALAMAFSNGFAEVSVLQVYCCTIGRKPWVLYWIFRLCFPCFSASRNRQMTSLGWEVGPVGGAWKPPLYSPRSCLCLRYRKRYLHLPVLVYPFRIVVPVSHG